MDQLPTIDFSHGIGPAVLALAAFIVPLAVRTFLKDRREAMERRTMILQQCARQAYNSVQNRIKRGDQIEDKQQAGLEALDRFLVLRTGKPGSPQDQEQARLIFDAIHGELCPGGTGTPPRPSSPNSPTAGP